MVEFQLRQFEPQIQHLKAQFASTKSDEALVTFNPVCGILNQNVIFSEPLPSVFSVPKPNQIISAVLLQDKIDP